MTQQELNRETLTQWNAEPENLPRHTLVGACRNLAEYALRLLDRLDDKEAVIKDQNKIIAEGGVRIDQLTTRIEKELEPRLAVGADLLLEASLALRQQEQEKDALLEADRHIGITPEKLREWRTAQAVLEGEPVGKVITDVLDALATTRRAWHGTREELNEQLQRLERELRMADNLITRYAEQYDQQQDVIGRAVKIFETQALDQDLKLAGHHLAAAATEWLMDPIVARACVDLDLVNETRPEPPTVIAAGCETTSTPEPPEPYRLAVSDRIRNSRPLGKVLIAAEYVANQLALGNHPSEASLEALHDAVMSHNTLKRLMARCAKCGETVCGCGEPYVNADPQAADDWSPYDPEKAPYGTCESQFGPAVDMAMGAEKTNRCLHPESLIGPDGVCGGCGKPLDEGRQERLEALKDAIEDGTLTLGGRPPDPRAPLDKTIEKVELHVLHGFTISWQAKNFGFGQISFHRRDDGTVFCDTECMSSQFVKDVLAKLVDTSELDGGRIPSKETPNEQNTESQ